MIYWQLHNSQQCWELLEQSFGGENQHPELYAGAGRKPARGDMPQKNGGDAALFLAGIQKSLAAPCQPAYAATTPSQRQRRRGGVRGAVIHAGSPTCSFSRVVTNVLPHTVYRGELETLPAAPSSEPCSSVSARLASEGSALPFAPLGRSLAGCFSSANTASVCSRLSRSAALRVEEGNVLSAKSVGLKQTTDPWVNPTLLSLLKSTCL